MPGLQERRSRTFHVSCPAPPQTTDGRGEVGSIASLTVDGYEIFSTKNFVEPMIMTVFNEDDRRVLLVQESAGTTEARPVRDSYDPDLWMESYGEGRLQVEYATTATAVRERLHVMGFSLNDLKESYERARQKRLSELKSYGRDPDVALSGELDAELELLQAMSFKEWLWNVGQIVASGIQTWDLDLRPELARHSLTAEQKYLLTHEESLFGFDLGDPRYLLRAALESARPEAEVIHDLTDVISGGWYEFSDRIAASSRQALRSRLGADVPIVVLTEGRTDSEFLSGAVAVLLPHLGQYYTFLDFESVGAAGGASALTATVKSFIGASIANRVVALFDNDAAAADAMRPLQRVSLPPSVRVLQLPPIPLASQYPTIGPTGHAEADVNGSAGSIELYFGEDILRRADGTLTPVIWKNQLLGRYHGELDDKGRLQDAFRAKLQASRAAGSPQGDWSGMFLILSRLVNAFTPVTPLRIGV